MLLDKIKLTIYLMRYSKNRQQQQNHQINEMGFTLPQFHKKRNHQNNNYSNIIRLPDAPKIIIRRFDPTNYQENGIIYVDPTRIETELYGLIQELQAIVVLEKQCIQKQNHQSRIALQLAQQIDKTSPHRYKNEKQQERQQLRKTLILRTAMEFNKKYKNKEIDLYLQTNLGHIYIRIGYHHKVIVAHFKNAIRIFDELQAQRYEYMHNNMPSQYLYNNQGFYNGILKKYWVHWNRGIMNLCISSYLDGGQIAMNAFADMVSCICQLLIAIQGALIGFIVRYNYRIKQTKMTRQKANLQLTKMSSTLYSQLFLSSQFDNYKQCINILYQILTIHIKNIPHILKHSPTKINQIMQLYEIVEAQKNTIMAKVQSYCYTDICRNITQLIPAHLISLDMSGILANKAYHLKFDDIHNWQGICVEIDVVFDNILHLLAAMFSICKYKHQDTSKINIFSNILMEMQEYIQNTKLFEEFKEFLQKQQPQANHNKSTLNNPNPQQCKNQSNCSQINNKQLINQEKLKQSICRNKGFQKLHGKQAYHKWRFTTHRPKVQSLSQQKETINYSASRYNGHMRISKQRYHNGAKLGKKQKNYLPIVNYSNKKNMKNYMNSFDFIYHTLNAQKHDTIDHKNKKFRYQ